MEGEDLGSNSLLLVGMILLYHNFLICKMGEPWFLLLASFQCNEKIIK